MSSFTLVFRTASASFVVVAAVVFTSQIHAQNSAPSSHMVFDDNFAGDIIINEVRVPKDGEAMYTYYEALGWRGKGAGYAGIQAHPRAHNFIFSIWDHKNHSAPIKAVHHGPGTETKGFGGEGTGLKSWNFELGWSTDVWYTLVARNWPVGAHTYYAFWVRASNTNKWTHLVTMDVGAENARFQGGTDAFIEDWLSTGVKPRVTQLRNGWKRKADGTWFPFGNGRYSVNYWDLDPGKRSYNYRTNWNGGVDKGDDGEFYFMVSGGSKTVAKAKNPSKYSIARKETQPNFGKLKIVGAKAKVEGEKLSVTWKLDETTTPQFSYEISLYDNAKGNGKPIAIATKNVPHARSATLDISNIERTKNHRVVLHCTDIFDGSSKPMVMSITE
jgi:hypothetical protein